MSSPSRHASHEGAGNSQQASTLGTDERAHCNVHVAGTLGLEGGWRVRAYSLPTASGVVECRLRRTFAVQSKQRLLLFLRIISRRVISLRADAMMGRCEGSLPGAEVRVLWWVWRWRMRGKAVHSAVGCTAPP